jgi:hypothetical protein
MSASSRRENRRERFRLATTRAKRSGGKAG